MDHIIIKQNESSQHIKEDNFNDGIVEPFVDFNVLLALYYSNVYHRRAVRLKAGLLSQIDTEQLSKHLNENIDAKRFLFAFALDLEIYGTAFIEKMGTSSNYSLYNLPSKEARLDNKRNIFQVTTQGKKIPLEGHYLGYYSPSSRFYGEPDYLAAILQIMTTQKADHYNSVFFDNGARPDLAIVYENSEPTQTQLDSFKTFFGSNFKGYDNAHKTLILSAENSSGEKDAKIKFENLSNISDLSFKQLKEVNRDEIAAAHGVPPRLLGIMHGSALGGGGELLGQLHSFNEIEIKPKIEILENFFNRIGLPIKLKPLDVTNFKDDSDVVTGLVSSKIITQEEAREILGWQKKPLKSS